MTAKNYKWELRKSSRKEVCPRCGQRRFVPYVSALDHKTLAGAMYGRCDREQNCGYICYPDTPAPEGVQRVEVVQAEPLRFVPAAVEANASALYTYAQWLLTEIDALAVWARYRIGAVGSRTIFWLIDENNEIRSGKAIHYLPNGHRDKTVTPPVQWCHKMPAFKGMYSGSELQQCLFGVHLLTKTETRPVAVVESEKTAAMMSAIEPQFVWVACGGSQGLKSEDKLKPLAGREVLLVPDHGQYWNWKRVADAHGWKIFGYIEEHPLFEGCDILDYYDWALRNAQEKNETK